MSATSYLSRTKPAILVLFLLLCGCFFAFCAHAAQAENDDKSAFLKKTKKKLSKEEYEREVINKLKEAGFYWNGGSWHGKRADIPKEVVNG